jgi:phosphocarrier protein HPr
MSERTVTISTPTGLHARPAAQFVKAAAAQPAKVTIAKAGGAAVPAASILAILGLQIEFGAEESLDALAELLSVNLDA